MWYIYTGEYYTAIKKNEIVPLAATWLVLEIIIPSELNQTQKVSYDIAYMQNLKKMIQMNLFTKQKQTHRKPTYSYEGERVAGRDRLGVWDLHVHTSVFKIGNQQGPIVQHRKH